MIWMLSSKGFSAHRAFPRDDGLAPKAVCGRRLHGYRPLPEGEPLPRGCCDVCLASVAS